MTATLSRPKTVPLEKMVANFGPIDLGLPMSKSDFVSLSERFPDLRMEREPDGFVSIMSPVKKGSGRREFNLSGLFFMWYYQHKTGEFYSPSTGFDLPNGATKSPDVAWVSPEKLAGLRDEDEETFVSVVPDFVAEVRSGTDRLQKLQAKMTDTWLANGVRLAWLIDPYEERAYIYRQGQAEPEIVEGFVGRKLSGEDVLPGFELPLDMMRRR